MVMREKLIELLQTSPTDIMGNHPVGSLADWLIANGVTIPVRCKDCKKREICRTTSIWAVAPPDDWYCADGERKDNDTTTGRTNSCVR